MYYGIGMFSMTGEQEKMKMEIMPQTVRAHGLAIDDAADPSNGWGRFGEI